MFQVGRKCSLTSLRFFPVTRDVCIPSLVFATELTCNIPRTNKENVRFFRHLLMAGGALFTEDIWKIICEGLRGAMRSTLAPIKHLIPCYQVGSSSVSGDDGYRVRVLTRRDASWEQTIRHGQLAEQVSQFTVLYSTCILLFIAFLRYFSFPLCVINTHFNIKGVSTGVAARRRI